MRRVGNNRRSKHDIRCFDHEDLFQLYSSDGVMPEKNPKEIYEKVDNLIRIRQTVPSTPSDEEKQDWKNLDSNEQCIQLQATLNIPHVNQISLSLLDFKRNNSQYLDGFPFRSSWSISSNIFSIDQCSNNNQNIRCGFRCISRGFDHHS